MNARPIQPRAVARDFKCNEMFFSTTNTKGIILAGNDVFVRVSGFTREELYGQPHNLIRHPDMPRAAFALLWTNLQQRRPFAGYVKNMAKDGTFYWVFVAVVPAGDAQYLSVRFKPGSALLPQVAALYQQMLTAENRALAGGAKESEAVTTGLEVAAGALKELGYTSYDTFSYGALNLEIKARDAQLQAEHMRLFPAALTPGVGDDSLHRLYAIGVAIYTQINGLFQQLDGFVQFNASLQKKAVTVLATATAFRLHALNVNIASQHHGGVGEALSVVAGFLGDCANQLATGTGALNTHIAEVARATETINARIAMARLQMEMLLYFLAEFATHRRGGDTRQFKVLEECFLASTTEACAALILLTDVLPRLRDSRETIARIAVTIEMAQVRGFTEAAHLPDAEMLTGMFAEFRARIGDTRIQLEDISTVMEEIARITDATPTLVAAINRSTETMQAGIAALTETPIGNELVAVES